MWMAVCFRRYDGYGCAKYGASDVTHIDECGVIA